MSRLFSHSLPRDIFDILRENRMLISSDSLSYSSKIRHMLPFHLPDVWTPAQYLIDLGLSPVLARRISSVYMDFFARYRQVFELYLRRVIHGGCQHPEYYRDILVVQFRSTIQVWESRIMSTVRVWLCQAGSSPTSFSLDVRVDADTKTHILSRLRHVVTSFSNNKRANAVEPSKEKYNTEGDFSTKMLSASPPSPLKSTIIPTRDLFSQEISSTCFPACYPPPPGEPISLPRKHLVTQFLFTTPAKNAKQYADRSVNTSSLVTDFGRMSVTTSGAGPKAQKNRKYVWAPRSKKPEPLSPLLSPIVAGVSDSPPELQSPNTRTISNAKSMATPRRRRIAALPTRHTKATTVPISDPVSSPATNPPVLPPASNDATQHKPISQITRASVTEGTPIGCVVSSPSTVQYVPPSQASFTTGTSDIAGSKPALSGRKKKPPVLRRVAPQSQTSPLPTRPPTPLAPSRQKIPFSNISRTPSLISDTSSCADTLSSSDEFDTPPSTPPSHSHDLTSCNALVTSVISSKSNSTKPFGLPMLANVDCSDLRKGKGIRIDFTNGDLVGEQQLNFTFRA